MASDGRAGQDICGREMLQRGDKTLLRSEPFVPNPIPSAVPRRHVNLVHRRVSAHPRIALSHGSGVTRELDGHFGILKISHPIRHAEMKQIENRRNAEAFDFRQCFIGKRPVVTVWSEMNAVIRKSVTQ